VRQSLLPLLRSALELAHHTGLPVMRPMMLMTDDPTGRGAHQQYFLGDHVLVAPLLLPGGRTQMWLPEGDWVPLVGEPHLTGERGWVDVVCGPDDFPAFLRADA
jgi:alpha-D-xyloside xylohydrolase